MPASSVTYGAITITDGLSYKGCLASRFSRSTALNSWMISYDSIPKVSMHASKSPLARIITWLFPVSTATYSKSGCRAMAKLAGRVHGVVVQITMETSFPANTGYDLLRSEIMGNFTKIEGDVCSSYSTSASASAVLHEMHQ